MKLHNTLTNKTEEFKPQSDLEIKLYTCGPTVYHYAHIGNLRNVIFNDTLRRVLRANDYKVRHVMNITDVGHLASDADEGEDKLEKGAAREGKTVWEVADFYIEAFNRHTEALNVLKPNSVVRATDAIDSQLELIQRLFDRGYAYQTKQAIYFDVSKLNDYGKLSGQNLDDKKVGVRDEVITDSDKHHPQDFALWFFAVGHFKDHQMRWESAWGEGFPGWHLECSAIIHQELGEPIDIHTGGVDHIGTHHTNEIAQSEAGYDSQLAQYWLHNEFLHQNGTKMSKSGGGTITLDDIIEKGYDPLALRLFYLQSHYRREANFSWENLDSAQSRLKNWRAVAVLQWQARNIGHDIAKDSYTNLIAKDIYLPLSDDLDTPEALANIDNRFAVFSKHLIPLKYVPEFREYLRTIDELLGLKLESIHDINNEHKALLSRREEARKKKEWNLSDSLRDQLLEQGIGLRDTDYGAIWYWV